MLPVVARSVDGDSPSLEEKEGIKGRNPQAVTLRRTIERRALADWHRLVQHHAWIHAVHVVDASALMQHLPRYLRIRCGDAAIVRFSTEEPLVCIQRLEGIGDEGLAELVDCPRTPILVRVAPNGHLLGADSQAVQLAQRLRHYEHVAFKIALLVGCQLVVRGTVQLIVYVAFADVIQAECLWHLLYSKRYLLR